MIKYFRWIGSGICLTTVFWVVGGTSVDAAAQQAKISTVDGRTISASIKAVDGSGNVTGRGLPAGIELTSLLRIETGVAAEKRDYSATVCLVGRDNKAVRVGANSLALSDEKLLLSNDVGDFELPLANIRAVLWSSSPDIEAAIEQGANDRDRVFVEVKGRQQTVPGIVETIDDLSVAINYKNKLRTIGRSKIAAVVFANVGFEQPRGVWATVQTSDDSRWRGVIKQVATVKPDTSTVLQLAISNDTVLPIVWSQVVEIKIESERLAFLSDLVPASVRESSDFVISRRVQVDRSVTGGPLRMLDADGQIIEFSKGLGVQASSRIEFENTKQFNRLMATVGIDAETGGHGDCQVAIEVDGVEKWSRRITAAMAGQAIDLDIRGSQRIALTVGPGREFDLADHVDWANARFIKTQ